MSDEGHKSWCLANDWNGSKPAAPSGSAGWQPGKPENPKGAYAQIFKNGHSTIEWHGEREHAWQQVIAWVKIPDQPKLGLNPRAFQDSHGHWVVEYSYPPNEKVSHER